LAFAVATGRRTMAAVSMVARRMRTGAPSLEDTR
jgi:hypothetical protein